MNTETLEKLRKKTIKGILMISVALGLLIGFLIGTQNQLLISVAIGLGLIFLIFAWSYGFVAKADNEQLREIFKKKIK